MKYPLLAPVLLCISANLYANACLIESDDAQEPIRLCQENISIPENLFQDSFCQPVIPDRSFVINQIKSCPAGAYGVCEGARTEGVAYQQSIHYYSNPSDAPVLKAYCEQISQGQWIEPTGSAQTAE